MNRYLKKTFFILCLALFFSGCFSIKPEVKKISYYSLEYDSPKIVEKEMLPVVIRVERFRVAPFYDTNKIVFREKEFTKNVYSYHKWWTNPADIVTYFLARDMNQAGIFKAVFSVDKSLPASHIINGIVEEFLEEDAPESWKAILSVNITLMAENEPDVSKQILLQKRYNATEVCHKKTPQSLAEAMSRAMADVSEKIINDVYQHLSTTLSGN